MGRTVYSTDVGRLCPDCGESVDQCRCKRGASLPPRGDGTLRIRRERKGRGGKTVTVITGFDMEEADLKALAKQLKQVCGSGGSLGANGLEIQGDQAQLLQRVLQEKGFVAKLAGG